MAKEEAREHALRAVAANQRWLREQVWWRRWRRTAIDRFWWLAVKLPWVK
jgi:hypothetical protein